MRQQRKSQFQAFYKQSEIQETQLSDSMFLPSIPFWVSSEKNRENEEKMRNWKRGNQNKKHTERADALK